MSDSNTPDCRSLYPDLPLVNRYQAAWAEHGTRVAQRQSVIQMYLAAAGVIYGFWFTNASKSPSHEVPENVDAFLAVGISALTISTSALIWMHNRVMQHLTSFMKDCEQYAAAAIEHCGGGTANLFYFYDKKSSTVRDFHRTQRILHRIVLCGILLFTNLSALVVARKTMDPLVLDLCMLSLAVSIFIPFLDLGLDRGVLSNLQIPEMLPPGSVTRETSPTEPRKANSAMNATV